LDLWKKTLTSLQTRVEPWDYKHWIQPVQCGAENEVSREIVLTVPDESHGRWLEEHFSSFFQEEFERLGQGDYRIRYLTYDAARAAEAHALAATDPGDMRTVPSDMGTVPAASWGALGEMGAPLTYASPQGAGLGDASPNLDSTPIEAPALNDRYRFESFVDGPTNQFAMSAARAVADHPGTRYNPLFIFGGVGLGKTHLLHAVGHAVREKNPHARVRYVTSEQFVNNLIQAIRTDKMQSFRSLYRDRCDVLLIDDIQFIAGKDRTQEEFFHLFNTLHSSHKQIVLTCDQLPQSIPDLEDRLRSRLNWGLTADIKPPGFETRVAILKAKAEEDDIELSDEVAMLVARHITRNVRELEGALVKLTATSKLIGRAIDLDLAHQALGSLISERLHRIAPDAILRLVAIEFKVSLADLKGPRRHRNITVPRQIAMYLLRELTDESLPQIGHLFGGRDHSTVINSLKRVEALSDANPEIRAQLDGLRRSLRDS